MTVFVDTSALFALLDADDEHHVRAAGIWERLIENETTLATSNYTLVECYALVHRRLGTAALRDLVEGVVPILDVHWIEEDVHGQAVAALLAAGRRHVSVVDCSSFVLMRRLGITTAFAFDRHFTEQGFVRVGR